MVTMNRPRWFILISCVFIAVITGLVAVDILVPGKEPPALFLVYGPFLTLLLMGIIFEVFFSHFAKRDELQQVR